MRVTLQTKLLVLIISLLLFVIVFLTVIFSYFESKQTEHNMGQLALQVATTVSFMPDIQEAFDLEDPSEIIQPIVEQIREEVGAEFIIVGNKDSIRYSHPQEWKIGKKMVGGDNDEALIDGEYYTSKAIGSLGPSLRGKAPVFDKEGNIIGIVSVGFMQEDIRAVISNRLIKYSMIAFFVLLLGIGGGVLLAKNIRKDILGLEPHQIASLYRERNAILYSIKEGIIAVDEYGKITLTNNTAKNFLGITDDSINQPIEDVVPNTEMYRVLHSGLLESDQEMLLKDRVVIVNRTPIIEKDRIVGVVASFRDKTEITKMVNTLSEVRKYSEDLRAQTHEFTNKLYALSGLLQLGEYQEAIEFIQLESSNHQIQSRILFEQILDHKVQAILLGKIGKASEHKINFTIDPNSFLKPLPKHVDLSKLITILGNIIDNAFEEVMKNNGKKEVAFFTTDIGNDIVFEVADTGNGIDFVKQPNIFSKGFSTKDGKNRGFGLASVKQVVTELNGTIEINNGNGGGAVFSIFIPKEMKNVG
ncbi:ATP-binding protein [Bacillus sp. REN16]|uniref:ATP-binding protein n=1 Tax=Bacillus sp. REN16 TaxID=2887296 RepID=UPI001E5B8BFF|nr:sensor histidine kinase [Bacillus sp. REN16]MCC3355467.1 sensor histidine kinase [Bacillus sp. REN16]